MQIDTGGEKPIFLQISEGIEAGILSGVFAEEEQVPSITEFAVRYTINPATALKGINLLVDEGVLYKKRGVGMFVCTGARARLREKHRAAFCRAYVLPMADEAKRLGIDKEEMLLLAEEAFE